MSTSVTVTAFCRGLRKWLDAVEAGRMDEARFHADQIAPLGRLVAIDPAFQRLFKDHAAGCSMTDVEEVVRCIHAFCEAATEAAMLATRRTGD